MHCRIRARVNFLGGALQLGSFTWACLAGCSSDSATHPPNSNFEAGLLDASLDAGQVDSADASSDTSATPFDGPASLSSTGLYSDILTRSLSAGVVPYSVRFPLWSDGSEKQRYLRLPAGDKIETGVMDWWAFPTGTKAWKEFSVEGKLVETRYLEKRADGWLMVAYLWNSDGTEAFPAPAGQVDALGTSHDVPSQADCEQCHNGVGDVLIGVSAIQLTGDGQPGMLSQLSNNGWLSAPPSGEPVLPGDAPTQAALGYLHGNCGHCHNDVHFLATKRALRLRLSVAATTPESTAVYQTTINAKMNHVINGTSLAVVAGQPTQSQLWVRMSYRALDSMPPLGTEMVDGNGLSVVKSWIENLQ